MSTLSILSKPQYRLVPFEQPLEDISKFTHIFTHGKIVQRQICVEPDVEVTLWIEVAPTIPTVTKSPADLFISVVDFNDSRTHKYSSLENLRHKNERFYSVIKRDKEDLLALPENWDEEGSKSYKETTVEFAIDFLLMLTNHFTADEIKQLASGTHLLPAGEGSVDLYIVADKFELLIVFREDRSVSYYGELLTGNNATKGEQLPLPEDIVNWVRACSV